MLLNVFVDSCDFKYSSAIVNYKSPAKWKVRFHQANFKLEFVVTQATLFHISKETNNDNSLLVIILDTNPSQRILRRTPKYLTECLNSICVLGNAHLMQRSQNTLAVLATHHNAMYVCFDLNNKITAHLTELANSFRSVSFA